MKLRRLEINALPGIEPGFCIDNLGPGVNVVHGPNAVGKSSLSRALGHLLYPSAQRDRGVRLKAELDGETDEHFPEIHDYEIRQTDDGYVLINRTADGRTQDFTDLVFHGGPIRPNLFMCSRAAVKPQKTPWAV